MKYLAIILWVLFALHMQAPIYLEMSLSPRQTSFYDCWTMILFFGALLTTLGAIPSKEDK